MAMSSLRRLNTAGRAGWRHGFWIAIIMLMSAVGSYIYACAAPFAAIAAVAALALPRNEGLASVAAALAINQFIGFAVLAYPQNPETAVWGCVIAIGILLAYGAAASIVRQARSEALQFALALCVALFAFEAVIYAAAIVLSPEVNDFTIAIVKQIFAINFVATALAIIAHQIATSLATYFVQRPIKA